MARLLMRNVPEYLARLFGVYLWGYLSVTVVAILVIALSRSVVSRQARPWPTLLVIAAAFAVFSSVAVTETWPTGDEPHYLIMAQSLVTDHDLDLRNNYQERQYLAYYPPVNPLQPHVSVVGEHWYPWHGIGLSVLAAPFFALAGRAGVVGMLTLATVAGLGVLWSLLRRAGFQPAIATTTTLVAGFTLPIASLSAQVFDEIPAFLFVGLALRAALATTLTWQEVGWLALSVCLLPWLHAKYLALAAIALLVAALRHHDGPSRRHLLAATGACALSVATLAVVSDQWYGLPIPGIQFVLTSAFGNPLIGVPGMLFDQQYGLLFVSPIYLLAIPGLVTTWWRDRGLALGLGLMLGVVLILAGTHSEWYGGETSPARYWAPVVPALALGLAASLANANAFCRRAAAFLAIPSFGLAYLMVAMPAGFVRYGDPSTHHDFFIGVVERALHVDLTILFPSFRTLEPTVWITTSFYLAAAVWIALRSYRTERPVADAQRQLPPETASGNASS